MWKETIATPIHLAKQRIESQCNISVDTIRLFGRGFDNIAYLVNDMYVFRFPTRQMGVECMNNEITLLPYLKKHITFPFSSPEFIGQPTK